MLNKVTSLQVRQPRIWADPVRAAVQLSLIIAASIGAVRAAPVPYVTVAGANGIIVDGNGVGQTPQVFNHGAQLSQSAQVDFAGAVGSISAVSSADLATGSLHVSASNLIVDPTNTFGQRAFGFAYIGDTFTHTQAANPALPFVWTNQSTATFHIHVDGNIIANPGLNTYFSDTVLALQLFRHANPTDGSLGDAFGGTRIFQCAGQATYWSLGRTQPRDNCGNFFSDAFMPDANGDVVADIDFSFQPGGDFDFAFGLQIGSTMGLDETGQGAVAFGAGSVIDDFLHTATITYTAPDGAWVTSGSGVFPGTRAAQTPEPSTWALSVLALLGAVGPRIRNSRSLARPGRRRG